MARAGIVGHLDVFGTNKRPMSGLLPCPCGASELRTEGTSSQLTPELSPSLGPTYYLHYTPLSLLLSLPSLYTPMSHSSPLHPTVFFSGRGLATLTFCAAGHFEVCHFSPLHRSFVHITKKPLAQYNFL